MKTNVKLMIILFVVLISGESVLAQDKSIRINVNGARFSSSIIQKWISEYQKTIPGQSEVKFQIENNASDNADLSVIAYQPKVENGSDSASVTLFLAKYALIPVANPQNPLLSKIAKRGLKKNELKNILFDKDIFEADDDEDVKKDKYKASVYSCDKSSGITIALANYFEADPARIKGKKLLGDEIFLINALKKDNTGISFNSINYVYDIQSRKLKQDIELLPLQLKQAQKDAFNSKDIDQVLSLLETQSIESVPVEKFGFVISKKQAADPDIINFVNWILAEGQKYDHELGFLHLDESSLTAQKEKIKEYFTVALK